MYWALIWQLTLKKNKRGTQGKTKQKSVRQSKKIGAPGIADAAINKDFGKQGINDAKNCC